jgi:hypothetical protein
MKVGDKVWVLCEVVEGPYRGCIECKNGPYCIRPLVSEVKPVEPEPVEQKKLKAIFKVKGHYNCGTVGTITKIKGWLPLFESTDGKFLRWCHDSEFDLLDESGKRISQSSNPEAIEDCTKTANDQLRQSLMDYPFGEPSNSSEIPNSSSDPMRAAFEAFMVKRYDPTREHLARNEDTQLYFDDETEMAWQAFQVGSKYQPNPLTPSPCMDGVDVDQFIEGVMHARGRTSDPVNPSHCKQLPAETIDIIEAAIANAPNNKAAGLHWQVLKYVLRCWFKNGIEDLKKARWYLDRLIQEEEAK